MLDAVRSTVRSAVTTVRELVEEAIDELDRAESDSAPAARRSSEARATARAACSSDAARLAWRQQIEAKLEREEVQEPESTFRFPPRAEDAPTGSELMRSIAHLGPAEREQVVLDQIRSGNVPDHLRRGRTIELEHDGHRAQVEVMPDYLAVGSNEDFVRIPMTPRTAQALADQTGAVLPTRKVVDAVWEQADVRLDPRPMRQERERTSTFAEHDAMIRAQLARNETEPGALIAGHKKDVVNTRRLTQRPDHVAIYGWHLANGKPIQGLSTVHHGSYVDYSHGVRLMSGRMTVDGRSMTAAEVLADPNLAGLLSHEGTMSERIPGQGR
jgi:hypothetical protein